MGGRDLKAVRGTDVCYIPVYSEGANPRIGACLCEIRDEGVSICLVAAVEESCYVRCGGRAGSAQTEIAYITRTLTVHHLVRRFRRPLFISTREMRTLGWLLRTLTVKPRDMGTQAQYVVSLVSPFILDSYAIGMSLNIRYKYLSDGCEGMQV